MLLKCKKQNINHGTNNGSKTSKGSRITAAFFSAIVFLSLITTLPILQYTEVGATKAADNRNDVDWNIQSLLYYNALSLCMKYSDVRNRGGTNPDDLIGIKVGDGYAYPTGTVANPLPMESYIRADNVAAGMWFAPFDLFNPRPNSESVPIGAPSILYSKDNGGFISCDSSTFINNALTLWGLTANQVLCNSGFHNINLNEEASIDDCVKSSPGDFQRGTSNKEMITKNENASRFRTYIKTTVYGIDYHTSVEPKLTPTEVFFLYQKSVEKTCIPGIEKAIPNITEANPEGEKLIDGDYTYNKVSVLVEGATTSIGTGNYKGTMKKTDNVVVEPWGGSISGVSLKEDTWQDTQTKAFLAAGIYTAVPFSILKGIGVDLNLNTTNTCSALITKMNDSIKAAVDEINTNEALVTPKLNADQKKEEESKTSCAIDGIGWIVCPVVNFLANSADGAFSFLAQNFLATSPKIFAKDNQTFVAWGVMRNFANIAFVIAFLIIIFSQITSFGITNYGIKKMLPRLIIAAVLVNLSYYICQIAVDLSNIIGWSLKDMLAGLVEPSGQVARGWLADGGGAGTLSFATIASAGLAITASVAILYACLSALIPVLLAACVALLMILFILIGRQALIVILVVISPLAFVAFLLPNTQDLFKKWQKAFSSMLLLFPIIALVFGGSTLAANILSGVFTSNVAGTDATQQNLFGQIILAGVMVLPLFVVPGLLKKSLDGIGGIGAKLNGLGAKVGGALGKGGTKVYDNTALARGRASRKTSMQNYRNQKFARHIGNQKSGIGQARRFFAGGANILPGQKYANQQLDRNALATSNALTNTEVENAVATMEKGSGSTGAVGAPLKDTSDYEPGYAEIALKNALETGDVVKARAAQKILLGGGDVGRDKLHNVLQNHYNTKDKIKNSDPKNQAMLLGIRTDLKNANLKGSDNTLATFSYTDETITDIGLSASTYSGLTPAQLLGQSERSLDRAELAAKASLTSPDVKIQSAGKSIINLAENARTSDVLKPERSGGKGTRLNQISAIK